MVAFFFSSPPLTDCSYFVAAEVPLGRTGEAFLALFSSASEFLCASWVVGFLKFLMSSLLEFCHRGRSGAFHCNNFQPGRKAAPVLLFNSTVLAQAHGRHIIATVGGPQ